MNNKVLDIIEKNGVIVAPAGYGKTETICEILEKNPINKSILVLTHTNAGVDTILKRIKLKFNIKCKYKIMTIASFCSKLVLQFPVSSKYKFDENDYHNIYEGMNLLLNNSCVRDIIKLSYDELIIDEYQDCNILQHKIILNINKFLPVKIFGDPLQSIYDFDGILVDFKNFITKKDLLLELNYPWRWKNNISLSNWLTECRVRLLNNESVNIKTAPDCVKFYKYTSQQESIKIIYKFSYLRGKSVVLFVSDYTATFYGKFFKGIFKVQEEVQCKTLYKFCELLDNNPPYIILKELFNIIKKSFINSSAEFKTIIEKIEENNFNFTKIKKNKELCNILEKVNNNFNYNDFKKLLNEVSKNSNIVLFREELWAVLNELIKSLSINESKKPLEMLKTIRSNESIYKYNFNKLISRILLVKGLDFDNVLLVLDEEQISNELLYVAITRATKNLWILYKDNI